VTDSSDHGSIKNKQPLVHCGHIGPLIVHKLVQLNGPLTVLLKAVRNRPEPFRHRP